MLDARTGKPLAFANVLVIGTTLGGISQADGRFTIKAVPSGAHEVQASFMGYGVERQSVTVPPEGSAEVEFRLRETIARKEKEVVVTAERPLVDVKATSTVRAYNADEISAMTVEPTLDSVVEQQPGVTRVNNQIHIRGGRSDETLFIIDGVQMRDLIGGESDGANISARSVAEVAVMTGSFEAKYGQALSGVVDAKTKDGTEEFDGWLGYTTDRLTGERETDIWEFELGGPMLLLRPLLRPLGSAEQRQPTFYLSVGVELENGYLPAIDDLPGDPGLRSGYSDRLPGGSQRYGSFFTPRVNNSWRVNYKTAWKASSAHKFSLSLAKSLSFNPGFYTADVSEIDRSRINYPWAYRDVWDRYYTSTRDQNTLALTWNHTVARSLVHTAKLARYFTATHKDVGGKRWDEYDAGDSLLVTRPDPYFRVAAEGDAPDYRDRFSRTWSLDSDWVWRWRRHDVKWGWRGQYETVQYFSVSTPSVSSARPLGKEYDLFKVTPNTGSFYLQDAVEQEGLIAKFGLRYDYWFPGEQVERLYRERRGLIASAETEREWLNDTSGLFGHRFKGHLSPRIEVSHPITDRDNLFFNYGHFSQRPNYFYVYAKSGTQSAEEFPRIGNPNLNPEISVQYELGAQHTFRREMALKVSLYYKDIYDYPTSTTIQLGESGTTRSSYFVYYNLDYARSRGLEVEWRRRGAGRSSWMASYTYSVTKGKGSDPNNLALIRATGGDARDTELDEVYMWWNRPHKLTLSFDYRTAAGDHGARPMGLPLPDDLSFNLYYLLQSGYAYTPADIFGASTGPDYSENGPYEQALNGTLRKGFRAAGRRFEATLQGWNLTDHRTVQGIDRVTGDVPRLGEGSLANSTSSPEWLRGLVSNPANRSAPRSIRLGLGVEL